MQHLNDDLYFYICNFLSFTDILNLSIVNKHLYTLLDDNFYKKLAIKYYTYQFWILANQRPPKLSKPLFTFKQELLRIENFQNNLTLLNYKRWCHKDFYNYWKSQE